MTFITLDSRYNLKNTIVTSDLASVLSQIDDWDDVSVDTETSSLSHLTGELLLISFSSKYTGTVVIDCTTIDPKLFFPVLNRPGCNIFHNIKFDYKWLKHYGLTDIKNPWDTYLAEKTLTLGQAGKHYDLKTLVGDYCDVYLDKSTRLTFSDYRKGDLFTEAQIHYASDDVEYLQTIYQKQKVRLKQDSLTRVAVMESKCALAYGDMEYNGIYLNKEYWNKEILGKYAKEVPFILDKLDDEVVKKSKENPNLSKYLTNCEPLSLFGDVKVSHYTKKKSDQKENTKTTILWTSPDQKLEVIKEIYGEAPTLKDPKTYTVKESVAKDALASWLEPEMYDALINRKDYFAAKEEAKSLIDWMVCHSLVSTVVNKFGADFLAENINPLTQRIHTEFDQLKETGRVSTNRPNIQNIPALQLFRSGFQPQEEDGWFICADYSGAELRIIAEASGERAMIDAFNAGEDVHSYLGTLAFGVKVSKTENKHLRNRIKTINFGLAYGAGPEKFADVFGGIEEAKEFINKKYFKAFPQLKKYFDAQKKFAKENGYSLTLPPFNRRRYYPEALDVLEVLSDPSTPSWKKSDLYRGLSKVGREGVNAPIQGTSADIMKQATVEIRKYVLDNNLSSTIKLISQIHDEIIIEVKGEELARSFAVTTKEIMEKAGELCIHSLKMQVDVDVARYWKK